MFVANTIKVLIGKRHSNFLTLSIRKMSKEITIEKHPKIMELTKQLANTMGIERGYKPVPKSRQHLQNLIPKDRKMLPERTMMDSFTVATIPLGSNVELQEIMVGITGQIRLSMLLEDMDIFAVIVAQNFIKNPLTATNQPSPYTIVTAQVNRIDFTDYHPKLHSDIRISGHVSWVGQSSVEVIVWLDQKAHNEYHRITKAVFLLAFRDAINLSSAFVNPLKPTNERERLIVESGEARRKLRMKIKNDELTKSLPTEEEQKLIHDMFQRTVSTQDISLIKRKLPPGCVWMSECVVSNIVHSHPSNRNLHNTVFGGFLMRNAADLAMTLAYMFSKHRPTLRTISDINFSKPVSMSQILRMHAHVVYTEMNYIQITVYAEAYDLYVNENITTNSFHLTFEVSEIVPEVFPRTYNEAMMFIDGRRHFHDVLKTDVSAFGFEPIDYGSDTKCKL